jgi:hypothetical protein
VRRFTPDGLEFCYNRALHRAVQSYTVLVSSAIMNRAEMVKVQHLVDESEERKGRHDAQAKMQTVQRVAHSARSSSSSSA